MFEILLIIIVCIVIILFELNNMILKKHIKHLNNLIDFKDQYIKTLLKENEQLIKQIKQKQVGAGD